MVIPLARAERVKTVFATGETQVTVKMRACNASGTITGSSKGTKNLIRRVVRPRWRKGIIIVIVIVRRRRINGEGIPGWERGGG